MTRSRKLLVGMAMLMSACQGDPPLAPSRDPAPGPLNDGPRAAVPASISPAAVSLAACTHHWASGVNGSWFDATKWAPQTVPGASSTACLDAAGTYTVTLDPVSDAVPVGLDGLSIGGGASGTQTLALAGTAALLNVTVGIDVKATGTFSVPGATGMVVTAGAVSNAGLLQTLPVCGGCGGATLRADLANTGTLRAATNGLILDKTDGVYSNTGTIDILGTITIPASTGHPSFTQQSGDILSTNSGTNGIIFLMQAGTFTYNGGNTIVSTRGPVALEGVDLAFGPSPVGNATINLLPSAAGNTFTGSIGAGQTVRLRSTGSPVAAPSRTLTLLGDVTNAGTLDVGPVAGTPFSMLTGTGTLTNEATGVLRMAGSGADSARMGVNFLNRGVLSVTGGTLSFDRPSLTYTNAGRIITAGVGTLQVNGATLTNEATAHLDIATRLLNGAHLRGGGTNATSLTVASGSTVDPGFSPGILTVGSLSSISGGILNMELGGDTAGTQYDQIVAALQTTLAGGVLKVTAVNDFEAGKCGQVFDIITHHAPGGSGIFATTEGLDQGSGRKLKVLYSSTTVKLVGLGAGTTVGVQTDPVSLGEGGPATQYYVCLGEKPAANVTVTASPDAQVTVTPASLTFTSTDWELPKAFTIKAVDDQVTEGAHTGRVTHAVQSTDSKFNGFAAGDLVANITDNDTNRNPTAGHDAATTPQETPVDIDVLANDSDPDGDALTIIAVTSQASGTAAIIDAGKKVRFSPAIGFSGSANFSYTIEDGHGGTATGGVTVTVTGPMVVDGNWTTEEDTPLVNNVMECTADLPHILTVTQPANGSVSILEDAPHRCGPFSVYVRFVPAANFNGTTSFTYAGIGPLGAVTGTITIHVTPVNDDPVAINDVASTTAPDPVVVSVLGNDSDVDGDDLLISAVTQPSSGSAAITGGGKTITYTPAGGFSGNAQFTYTASDGHGGSASASVTVAVAPGATPPLVIDWETPEDTPLVRNPLASPGGCGIPSILTVTQPSNGRVAILTQSFGSCGRFALNVRFVPAPNFTGTTSFEFTGRYPFDGTVYRGRVNVQVTPVNDNPTARNDVASTTSATPATIAVLANDTDVDGDQLTVTAVTQPASGSAAIAAGGTNIIYTPTAGFSGVAQFTYTVGDGQDGTATATVRVTVRPNRAPRAANDSATTLSPAPVTIAVLANDTDPDGDPLQVSAVTQPTRGSVVISGGGQTLTYSPPAAFAGTAQFRYAVSDGHGGTSSATVRVRVLSAADLQITAVAPVEVPRFSPRYDNVITVRNLGPSTSAAGTVTLEWSEMNRGSTVALPRACQLTWASSFGYRATCRVAALAPGAMTTLTIGTHPGSSLRPVTLTVTISSSTSDPNPVNNTTTSTTTFNPY